MSTEETQSDWTYSDLHKRLMQATSKDERLALWDEYAQIYDDAAVEIQWKAPISTVERIWDKLKDYPVETDQKIRVLDIGCGTGLVGEEFQKLGAFDQLPIHLIGLDFKDAMLEVARKKVLYHELVCDDFHDATLPDGLVVFLIASGVFWQGDYGPETLPVVLGYLKEGGYASITVRRKWFLANEKGFEEGIDKCSCDLVDNTVLPYIGDKVEANYLLVRKRSSA